MEQTVSASKTFLSQTPLFDACFLCNATGGTITGGLDSFLLPRELIALCLTSILLRMAPL